MFEILDRQNLAPGIALFEVLAPRIAKKHRAGQFVMVRPSEASERIPLPVASTSLARQSISVAVKAAGKTTVEMAARFGRGDSFHNVAGPLGTPIRISLPGKEDSERGTVVCAAGGVGAAAILPIARAFTEKGHEVVTIAGARTAELLILKDQLDEASERILVSTDDGSLGRKAAVTEALSDFIVEQRKHGEDVHFVIAIGPALMMKACAELTRSLRIPILVSLNTIMVDGIGRCGSCRALIGGETKYVCVDGPGFDGHLVDFDALIRRQRMYTSVETGPPSRFQEQHTCHAEAAITSQTEMAVAAGEA